MMKPIIGALESSSPASISKGLHLIVVLAGMKRVEIGDSVDTYTMTASPSITDCFCRFFRADSTIQG